MLLHAAFVISAGFSLSAPRQPCTHAACQQQMQRAAVCASADSENNEARARLESLWLLPDDTERGQYERMLTSTGGDVWASKDLLSPVDGKLLVKKHTKGILQPRSEAGPSEQLVVVEELLVVEWEHRADDKWDASKGRFDGPGEHKMKVTADMLTSREPPLPGGFTRGDVWATSDLSPQGQDDTPIVTVKKHTKGSILGPSSEYPTEYLVVEWEHRVDIKIDCKADRLTNTHPDSLCSREPPLPGGFIRGDVWASYDLAVAGIVAVRKHTKGSLIGPSVRDPTEQLKVSWEHRVDGNADPLASVPPGGLTSREPPLPGGFTRGDVWAAGDVILQGQEDTSIVAVKKHTKGSILGPSVEHPTERLLVSWEHCVDDNAHPRINTHLGWLTSQEPPLPGGFTRGDVVWAGCNIAIVGQNDKDIVGVKKHTKGTVIGAAPDAPMEKLVVAWVDGKSLSGRMPSVHHEKLMSREPPLPGGFIRGDVWASCDLVVAGIVAVKKHTKGSLIGPSIRDPTERLVVSWSQNDGTYESFNVFPKQLTPREGS